MEISSLTPFRAQEVWKMTALIPKRSAGALEVMTYIRKGEHIMFDDKGRFVIEDYGMKSTFSSFLPGISGKRGIPIWSFYVNRGQGICSFGTEDKEHSIMEFYPAQQAYQNTPTIGFRTFLKVEGQYYEPFKEVGSTKTKMFLGTNELEIQEINEELGIQVNVMYYTLPGELLGGLVRRLSIRNLSGVDKKIEYLDGMPAILPFGVPLTTMKEMGQTIKAWMMVEDLETNLPYYKVRTSIQDSTVVTKIEGGHFYLTVDEEGHKIPALVDPEVVFAYETSLNQAVGFQQNALNQLYAQKQMTENHLPCGFFGKSVCLKAGEAVSQNSIIGKTDKKEFLRELEQKCSDPNYFDQKQKQANALTEEVCSKIQTQTGSKEFDAYCGQTFLDNALRGGYPIVLGDDKIFYVYGRKHGDIERDYNFFSMLPEWYSQGNGNYRDVNQNRRCDVQFAPYVKDKNIREFYNLIQIDGYNPMLVQKTTYTMTDQDRNYVLQEVQEAQQDVVREHLLKSFTPGSLLGLLNQEKVDLRVAQEAFLHTIMNHCEEHLNAEFGEGYWTDHWTYNLDLIESYLSVYPEQEETLLFGEATYIYFEAKAVIKPRNKRYVSTEAGVRQYHAIDTTLKKECTNQYLQTEYGKGAVYTSNLMTKLVLLSINKFAALDPYGMGIEMEGGKPGWYDALNGLPGIFGSSMAETYELYRMNDFIIEQLKRYQHSVLLPMELHEFMMQVEKEIMRYQAAQSSDKNFTYWDKTNEAKEAYREKTCYGIEGRIVEVKAKEFLTILAGWQAFLKEGIEKALVYGAGLCPTYFAYEMTQYENTEEGILPKAFEVIVLPHFLEGPVRFLKLANKYDKKKEIYDKVKSSPLYDQKLQMYKVNESLASAPFEVGRAKAFTPGWLENESIWLHMEYKYLLELLRSELYPQFLGDLKKACIPFLEESTYGRSILENSSFIASSANPDEKIHGKGFVARLSGSTVEFINMWQVMMFGKQPFMLQDTGLTLSFAPTIPGYLIGEEKVIEATFLGTIKVTYQLSDTNSFIPGDYQVKEHKLTYLDGSSKTVEGNTLYEEEATAVRAGKVTEVTIVLQK